jgi:hypothetical protein
MVSVSIAAGSRPDSGAPPSFRFQGCTSGRGAPYSSTNLLDEIARRPGRKLEHLQPGNAHRCFARLDAQESCVERG